MSSQAKQILQAKLDFFMQDFILPRLNPEEIFWLFSLSGGVDSWVTRHLVQQWYQERGLTIHEQTFHVDQWSAPIAERLRNGYWGGALVSDVRSPSAGLGFNPDTQAQCGPCSILRREATDKLVSEIAGTVPGMYVTVARGHHLTDLAVSIIWRFLAGRSPISDLASSGKGQPFSLLDVSSFIAKPLIYATKAEIESFAKEAGIVGSCACLSCPAHANPSRRDIINQTAVPALAMTDSSWELHLPGIRDLFTTWTNGTERWEQIGQLTEGHKVSAEVPGSSSYLPDAVAFYERMLDYPAMSKLAQEFDLSVTLDVVAFSFLGGKSPGGFRAVPVPDFLLRILRGAGRRQTISREDLMLLCYGPFWGSFALQDDLRKRAAEMQAELFPGVVADDTWAHSAEIFRLYRAHI